jgi:S-DNA-T family DNA segregation ATPase FtsK/SpoIIIE
MTRTAEKQSPSENDSVRKQIWGLLYISLSLLLILSLGSHFAGSFVSDTRDNLLGPYLGTYLSLGVLTLFGSIGGIVFACIIGYAGWMVFYFRHLKIQPFLLSLLFLIEISVLAAVPALSQASVEEGILSPGGDNLFGYALTHHVFYPLLGPRPFGAYFIILVAMIMTLTAFFNLDLTTFFRKLVPAGLKSKLALLFQKGVSFKKLPTFFSSILSGKKTKRKNDRATQTAIDIVQYTEPEPLSRAVFSDEVPDYGDDESSSEYSGDEDSAGDTGGNDHMEEESGDFPLSAGIKTSGGGGDYSIPSAGVIPDPPKTSSTIDHSLLDQKSRVLMQTLEEFNVKGCRVVAVRPGPVVSRFEIEPAQGVPIRKILKLQDDLALKVGGKAIRILAPIPGKSVVGIEIPNDTREIVYFKEILCSSVFKKSTAALPVIVGKSISGQPLVEDISKMPHLLIAGQTGAGKSVGINSFIASLLLSKTPEELRLILIDPKKVEMACYEGIPHLMSPVVTEPEKSVAALQWAVREMESRYKLLSKVGSKNITSFNTKCARSQLGKYVDQGLISENDVQKLPYIVIIVDELADLMMTASKDVEALIQRIAQLARAVGIHLIVATQRPSVDIITGPIKANLTSRISFRTIQSQDSRTILGSVGAEKLLGMGDMLYLKNGAPAIERYHGAFISEEDVENLVEEIRKQNVDAGERIEFRTPREEEDIAAAEGKLPPPSSRDENFEEAGRLIISNGIASTSMIQRRLKVGYARAGRIMDELEKAGIVGPPQGSKPRELLVKDLQVLDDMLA